MTGPYVRFDLERVLKGSCSQNKQTKGEKPLVCRVLPGFAFAFVFWAVGSGLWARGLWFALGWALGLKGLCLTTNTQSGFGETFGKAEIYYRPDR